MIGLGTTFSSHHAHGLLGGRLLGGLAASLLAANAAAQSMNVDFSTGVHSEGFGVPSAAFGGAANQPGFWTEFDASVDGPVAAMGLDGLPTGASMFLQGPSVVMSLNDPGTTGDVEALLDDSIGGFGDAVGTVTLSGLEPGRYRVVVYGFAGGLPEETTLFTVQESSGVSGGAWSGAFEEGVTHVTLHGSVFGPDRDLVIEAVGGVFGQSGYLNGFQLTRIGFCDADLNFDGILDNGDIYLFVEYFLAGDFFADTGNDGILDNGDIGDFVEAFLNPGNEDCY